MPAGRARVCSGAGGFVLLHLPIVAIVLCGAIALEREHPAGGALALVVAAGALAAAGIHAVFLRAGHPEFRSATSLIVLAAGALAGLALAVSAIALLISLG